MATGTDRLPLARRLRRRKPPGSPNRFLREQKAHVSIIPHVEYDQHICPSVHRHLPAPSASPQARLKRDERSHFLKHDLRRDLNIPWEIALFDRKLAE
jgi:hypothetical protein